MTYCSFSCRPYRLLFYQSSRTKRTRRSYLICWDDIVFYQFCEYRFFYHDVSPCKQKSLSQKTGRSKKFCWSDCIFDFCCGKYPHSWYLFLCAVSSFPLVSRIPDSGFCGFIFANYHCRNAISCFGNGFELNTSSQMRSKALYVCAFDLKFCQWNSRSNMYFWTWSLTRMSGVCDSCFTICSFAGGSIFCI